MIGQTIRHRLPEHRTHRAVAAVLQLPEEDRFLVLLVPEELSEIAKINNKDPKQVAGTVRRETERSESLREVNSLFEVLADHHGNVLTVLLGGAEDQA